jgi:hypothetical protein
MVLIAIDRVFGSGAGQALASHDHDIVIIMMGPEKSRLRQALRSAQASFADSIFIEISQDQFDADHPAATVTDRLDEIQKVHRSRNLSPRPVASETRAVFRDKRYTHWASCGRAEFKIHPRRNSRHKQRRKDEHNSGFTLKNGQALRLEAMAVFLPVSSWPPI